MPLDAASFYPVDTSQNAVNRGPARLMYATMSMAIPSQIAQVINVSTYAALSGWNDLGSTKGGVTISYNNTEDELTIDQVNSPILTIPDASEMSVNTALAESTLTRLSFAWEGDVVTTNAAPLAGPEVNTAFGPFDTYTQRRLAVGFRNPNSGKVTLWVFRQAQRAPQDSSITYLNTGDQITIPVSFRVLPDTSVATLRQRFCVVFSQGA